MGMTDATVNTIPSAATEVAEGNQFAGNDRRGRGPGRRGSALSLSAAELQSLGLVADSMVLTAEDIEGLLRIVEATARIHRHYELFHFLQREVQRFIPHKILISAWCNFHGSNLNLDVISPILGVRTAKLNGCGIENLLRDLYMQWVGNGRQAILLNDAAARPITQSTCYCALHSAMRRMGSVLMHGVHDERDEIDSIYVAMNPAPITNGRSTGYFLSLINPIIAHIDVAFRKVAPLKRDIANSRTEILEKSGILSPREQEIMRWMTEGKTNMQIAEIVGISSFTVKNHVQRIFRKLGATNRTQAVAMHRHADSRMQTETATCQNMISAE